MDWWILGYIIFLAIVINFTYRKGVRGGIKHSIMTLNLDAEQINTLNKELEKSQSKLVLN